MAEHDVGRKPVNADLEERDSVVLVAARDEAIRIDLASALAADFTVIPVASAHEGEQELTRGGVGAVLCSTKLEDMSGIAWLGQLRRRREIPAIRIFVPEKSSEALAMAAINEAGAFRYIADPQNHGELRKAVEQALHLVGHRAGPPCMREAVGKAIKAHALCRGSRTGCLLKAKAEPVDLPPWLVRRLSSMLGWTGMGMMGMAMLLLAGLFMGIGVFTVLYVFKSALGIDLVDGWHLTDWLHR
ncbi:response regulator [Desulfonatronum thioautotrophicum]|uniref:response regulator n=1 Tax=Desulfonatronum thioautotrophicum TaxID=617001 RepID=UPI0005EAE577|nr:response regulator [Desulfonatronum thioautotrophicum]